MYATKIAILRILRSVSHDELGFIALIVFLMDILTSTPNFYVLTR